MNSYPLFKAHIPSESAIKNIDKVFSSGYINEGTEVTLLEQALKEKLAATNLTLVNSCTSAITLALKLCDVEDSDVISTPMTCVASNTPIVNSNAQIVWADIDPRTGMLTPQTIKEKITNRTKAVIVVAWAGTPPDLEGIRKVCAQRNIPVILDAAHAFGARFNGKPIHEYADYTCYSFQAIKHFTTGDGGAIVCSRTDDHYRVRTLKWFGLDRDSAKDARGDWKGQQWDVDIVEAGFKFNMNNVSAAIGLAQMDHIDRILERHKNNAALYDSLFANNVVKIRPVNRHHLADSSAWVYTVTVDDDCKITRDELLKALNNEGIMAGVVHVPNDTYTCFESFKCNLPGTREFSKFQFSLPCGWWLDGSDINHVFSRVKELTT